MSTINAIFAFAMGVIISAGFYDIKHGGDYEKGYDRGLYEQRATQIQEETFRKARLVKYGLCGYATLACEVPRDRRVARR